MTLCYEMKLMDLTTCEVVLTATHISVDCQAFQVTTHNISINLAETLGSKPLTTDKLLLFLKTIKIYILI